MLNLTDFTKHIGKKLANDNNLIEEGISMTDFRKMMNKVKRSGVNLNRVSATKLMFYLYNTMPKPEFDKITAAVEDMKTPIDCGYDDDSNYGCGGGYRRSSRRSYSCGYDDDGYHC